MSRFDKKRYSLVPSHLLVYLRREDFYFMLCRLLKRYYLITFRQMTNLTKRNPAQVIEVCKENYTIGYPILYSTPAYNFF